MFSKYNFFNTSAENINKELILISTSPTFKTPKKDPQLWEISLASQDKNNATHFSNLNSPSEAIEEPKAKNKETVTHIDLNLASNISTYSILPKKVKESPKDLPLKKTITNIPFKKKKYSLPSQKSLNSTSAQPKKNIRKTINKNKTKTTTSKQKSTAIKAASELTKALQPVQLTRGLQLPINIPTSTKIATNPNITTNTKILLTLLPSSSSSEDLLNTTIFNYDPNLMDPERGIIEPPKNLIKRKSKDVLENSQYNNINPVQDQKIIINQIEDQPNQMITHEIDAQNNNEYDIYNNLFDEYVEFDSWERNQEVSDYNYNLKLI